MTEPYMFRWFKTGVDAVAAVRLEREPTLGQCVWIAGRRYKVLSIDRTESQAVIIIDTPEYGYKEPKNAIGTLDVAQPSHPRRAVIVVRYFWLDARCCS